MQVLGKIWISLAVLWCCSVATFAQSPAPLDNDQQCRNNLQILLRGLTQYARDNKGLYPSGLEKLVPRYLSKIPTCPADPKEGYVRYSVVANQPPRAALICSNARHNISPPDYLVLSSDRGEESPFTHKADPSICRRTLVTLGQQLQEARGAGGLYPTSLTEVPRCSCGDAIQYTALENRKEYFAFCPGAAHLGSGLAPFSPSLSPRGLQEDSLLLTLPVSQSSPEGLGWPLIIASGLAVGIILVLLVQAFLRRRPIRLD